MTPARARTGADAERGTILDLSVEGDVAPEQVEAARRAVESVTAYTNDPPYKIRLTLRRDASGSGRPFVADASTWFDGRMLAAHAAAPSPVEAAEAAARRLRRQVRRTVGSDVAMRDEPRAIRRALEGLPAIRDHRPAASRKPPEKREIVSRSTYSNVPLTTLEAVGELLDLDLEFLPFRHAETGEDVVVARRDDGRITLLHPPGSPPAGESVDDVVPEPSRYPGPMSLATARTEMDLLNHRFLYFIDEAGGRGKVIYLRHDGDYGLVEPEQD